MNKVTAKQEFVRVCEALPRLTPAELEQVRLRLGFLADGAEDNKAPTKPSDSHDWLLRGFEEELRRRGLLGQGALPAERIVSGWKKTSETVRADLLRALGDRPDPRKLAAYGRLVARSLSDYLEGGGVPTSPKTLLNNAGKALVAIDAQFPGYAEAGLLGCCLDTSLVGRG